MTQAFRLNLTILSALALLVGLYLILQGLDAAVTRRQMEGCHPEITRCIGSRCSVSMAAESLFGYDWELHRLLDGG